METGNRRQGWKSFLIILAVTLLVWLGVSMSTISTYPTMVRVAYVGVDTARYAVLQADTTVTFNMVTNGFTAFQHSLSLRQKELQVKIPSISGNRNGEPYTVRISVAQQIRDYRNQLGLSEKVNLQPVTENLQIVVAERQSKVFYPRLDQVSFSFAPGYSLYGMPCIEPDSVVLYGSASSLSKVSRVDAAATQIANIGLSDTFSIPLDDSWRKYPDLRISHSTIRVYIPTEESSEQSVEVPVRYTLRDSSMNVRLYPDRVTVNYWVATKDYERPRPEDFVVEARGFERGVSSVPLVVTSFPDYVRIKDLSSNRAQVVFIQKQKKNVGNR